MLPKERVALPPGSRAGECSHQGCLLEYLEVVLESVNFSLIGLGPLGSTLFACPYRKSCRNGSLDPRGLGEASVASPG